MSSSERFPLRLNCEFVDPNLEIEYALASSAVSRLGDLMVCIVASVSVLAGGSVAPELRRISYFALGWLLFVFITLMPRSTPARPRPLTMGFVMQFLLPLPTIRFLIQPNCFDSVAVETALLLNLFPWCTVLIQLFVSAHTWGVRLFLLPVSFTYHALFNYTIGGGTHRIWPYVLLLVACAVGWAIDVYRRLVFLVRRQSLVITHHTARARRFSGDVRGSGDDTLSWAPTASQPAMSMHPQTLSFNDVALETEYTSRMFRGGFGPAVAVLVFVTGIQVVQIIVFPWDKVKERGMDLLLTLIVLAWRVHLHQMVDVAMARRRLGAAATVLNILNVAYRLHDLFRTPSTLCNDGGEAASESSDAHHLQALGYVVVLIYLHITSFPSWGIWLFVSSWMLYYFVIPHLMPSCSPGLQGLWLGGSVVLGELIGYTLEVFARSSFIRMHELVLQQQRTETKIETYRRDKEELKQLALAKDNFVAALSHEMRTPLNGILGMLQLAQGHDRTDEVQEYIEHALSAGAMLKQLLDDALDVTRIEQGRLPLELSRICLTDAARTCVHIIQPTAEAKRIDLCMHVDEALKVASECMVDSRRLQQVILNLLSNAIKFTPSGGNVTLTLARTGADKASDDAAGSALTAGAAALPESFFLSVRDSGIGIHPEELDLIFLKYTKATAATKERGVDRHAGAGLGLSISKAIVEQHGGAIWVESTPGKGSTFFVRLKLLRAPRKEGDSVGHPLAPGGGRVTDDSSSGLDDHDRDALADVSTYRALLDGQHILIADNSETSCDVLREMLLRLGCTSHTVLDGHAAVEAVRDRRVRGEPFDAVLMDVQMPIMTGIEATDAIRNAEAQARARADAGDSAADFHHQPVAPSSRLPIIAVTSFAGAETRQQCLEHNCMDDYITKPVTMGELGSKLVLHLGRRYTAALGNAAAVRNAAAGDGNDAAAASNGSPHRVGDEESSHWSTRPAPVTAPAEQEAAATRDPPREIAWPPNLRVLLADDYKVNTTLLQKSLLKFCCATWRVTTTSTADKAVALYASAMRKGDPFGLVISDEQFDERSSFHGTEAIRRMREDERAHHRSLSSPASPLATSMSTVFVLWTANETVSASATGPAPVVTAEQVGPHCFWCKPLPPWKNGTTQELLSELLSAHSR